MGELEPAQSRISDQDPKPIWKHYRPPANTRPVGHDLQLCRPLFLAIVDLILPLHMWRFYIQNHPRYGKWYSTISRQPRWIVKAAIVAAVVPIVLLTIGALVVGIVVFVVLGLITSLIGAVIRIVGGTSVSGGVAAPGNGGRVNVRAIRRD